MGELTDRKALVTGAARGLGAQIVRDLAVAGADVAFTYLQDDAAADALVAELREGGRLSVAIRADVRDFLRAQEVVGEVRESLGGIHVLVCNAGVARSSALVAM